MEHLADHFKTLQSNMATKIAFFDDLDFVFASHMSVGTARFHCSQLVWNGKEGNVAIFMFLCTIMTNKS